jgi:hypothetical protein
VRGTLSLGVVALASCGRLGFGEQPAPDGGEIDAPPLTDAPPAQVTQLVCGMPQRFQIGAGAIASLVTTPSNSGFALASVDPAGNLAGWAYEFDATTLAPAAQNLALDSDVTETLGNTATNAGVLVAAVKGRSAPTGTTVYARTSSGQPAGEPITYAEIAGDRPLATSTIGQPVIIAYDGAGVAARKLTEAGAYIGAPRTFAPATDSPGAPAILAGPDAGFVVTWVSATTSPNALMVARLGANLEVTHGPVQVNSGAAFEPGRSRPTRSS